MVFDEQVSAKLAEEWLMGRAPGSSDCVLTCRLLQLLRRYPVQPLFTSVLLLGRWGLQAIKAIRRTQAVIIIIPVAQARSTPICQMVLGARGKVIQLALRLTAHLTVERGPLNLHLG